MSKVRKWRDIRGATLEERAVTDPKARMALLRRQLEELAALAHVDPDDGAEFAARTITEIEKLGTDAPDLSVVRGFVEALGGELEVVAKVGYHRVTLAV